VEFQINLCIDEIAKGALTGNDVNDLVPLLSQVDNGSSSSVVES
jgi:hypothetical protein